MAWTERERRDNARSIMAGNIDRDSVGRKLTSEAREKAIEFAVDTWKGNMGNGEASQIGIRHATSNVLKENK